MPKSSRGGSLLLVMILAFSGTGAWLSGQLVKQHADLWGAGGAKAGLLTRMCQAAEQAGFSCSGATKGRWAEIGVPLPSLSNDLTIGLRTVTIPVAFLGLAYFIFVGVWFAFIGRPRPYGGGWYRVPLGLGLCGAAVSLLFLGAMALRFAPACIWCIAVHLINFMMVRAIWRLCARAPEPDAATAPLSSTAPPGQVRAILTSREATVVIAFSLILITGLWAYRRERLALQDQFDKLLPYRDLVASLRQDPEFLLREYLAQPQHQIALRPRESIAEDRPRLVVFTDFECSACYCNSLAVRGRIAEAFNGQLAILIRHYPLCNDCNRNVRSARHANACTAAYAAEAARLLGGEQAFQRMYALLFKHGPRLSTDLYRELAVQVGLDPDLLLREMEGETVRQIVAADIALASELGVTGTPTMFLDGRRITDLCQGSVFWKTVARGLDPPPNGGQELVAQAQSGLAVSATARRSLPWPAFRKGPAFNGRAKLLLSRGSPGGSPSQGNGRFLNPL